MVPPGLVRVLEAGGLQVEHIITLGWRGASDTRIRASTASAEPRVSRVQLIGASGRSKPSSPRGGSLEPGGAGGRGSAGHQSIAESFTRLLTEHACIAYTACMQYTIRGIPPAVDSALRQSARAAGKSLNEAAVDALAEGSGMAGAPRKRRNLGDIAGTWKGEKAVEAALAAQDRVDEDLWR